MSESKRLVDKCPKCGEKLKYSFFTTVEGEDIPEAEYCDCGYVDIYSEE